MRIPGSIFKLFWVEGFSLKHISGRFLLVNIPIRVSIHKLLSKHSFRLLHAIGAYPYNLVLKVLINYQFTPDFSVLSFRFVIDLFVDLIKHRFALPKNLVNHAFGQLRFIGQLVDKVLT